MKSATSIMLLFTGIHLACPMVATAESPQETDPYRGLSPRALFALEESRQKSIEEWGVLRDWINRHYKGMDVAMKAKVDELNRKADQVERDLKNGKIRNRAEYFRAIHAIHQEAQRYNWDDYFFSLGSRGNRQGSDAPIARTETADRRITSAYIVKPFSTPSAYREYGQNIDGLLRQAQGLYLLQSERENLQTISRLVRGYHRYVADRDWIQAERIRVRLDTYLPDAEKAISIAPGRRVEIEHQERMSQLERHHREQMQRAERDRRERERQRMEQMKRQKQQHRELMDQLERQRQW